MATPNLIKSKTLEKIGSQSILMLLIRINGVRLLYQWRIDKRS